MVVSSTSDGVMRQFTPLQLVSYLRRRKFTSLTKLHTTMSHLLTAQPAKKHVLN